MIQKNKKYPLERINNLLTKSKKPLIVCGQGVKISNTFQKIYSEISKNTKYQLYLLEVHKICVLIKKINFRSSRYKRDKIL